MALKISDSRSFKIQPLKKNNWVFQFSAIPGNDGFQPEALAFVAKSCNAPKFSTDSDIDIQRMNETYKFAGSPKWDDIECKFYDFIRNTTTSGGELSAGDILYNWSCMVYNPLTGQMGYKTQYATSATLAQLDPAGNIIRAWNIFGIWPQSVDYGDLDYTSGEACEISATFKYDLAIKISDSKTSTESA
jgi:hypothetical protein